MINFCGQTLPITTHFKHLGVIFDSKLTWRPHINRAVTKVRQLINSLLSFGRKEYGLNSKAMETIYKGAVLPVISYGDPVWAEAIERKFVYKPLASLQRHYAIRLTRSYRTISYSAAEVIANLMQINIHLKDLAIEYFISKGIDNKLVNEFRISTQADIDLIQ